MIWGDKWDKRYNDNAELIADEWTDALVGYSRQAIKQGLAKARQTLAWPPTIAEFIQLCQGTTLPDSKLISLEKAGLSAIATIKKHFPWGFKNKAEYFMQNDIINYLTGRIYATQDVHCDFAKCAVDDCYHFEIFDKPYLAEWLCVQHFKG